MSKRDYRVVYYRFWLLLLLVCCSKTALGQVQHTEIKAFLYADGGYVQPVTTGYAANFAADGSGSFGWDFNNPAPTTLQNARLLVFLDAELAHATTTFFNESGALVNLSLPPSAMPRDIAATSWEIDEPGFLFGDLTRHLATGALDNTNSVPASSRDDVSLALGFQLGALRPNAPIKIRGLISSSNIGGLSQTDGDANTTIYFNAFVRLAQPPTIIPGVVTRQQGGFGGTEPVATVSSPDFPASSLTVTVTKPVSGVTVENLANTNGTITANVVVACNVTIGALPVELTVTDGSGQTAAANLTVNVMPNTPPMLGAYPASTVQFGASSTITPNAPPGDSGPLRSVTVAAPGFGGTASVNAATGVVTITNARPVGVHTVTVTATDNCGAVTTASFMLTIPKVNSAMALTASAAPYVVRQPITFTSAVTSALPGAGTPTGAVTFSDDARVLGTSLLDAAGRATLTTSALAAGEHTITASYNGDATFNPSSATLNLVVTRTVANVSAASYRGPELASEQIVAAFGTGLATATVPARTLPLPTALADTTVKVTDSAGTERDAPLFFVSPGQVNYQMPPGTTRGQATVKVTSGDKTISLGTVQIVTVAPGTFAADATGQGLASAQVLRVRSGGAQVYEPVARFDRAQNKWVAVPIVFAPAGEQLFLVLYCTGLRFRTALTSVTATIGGVGVSVQYAGPQGTLVGVDQVNLRLVTSLAGRGEVDVVLTVEGKATNAVRVYFQ